MYHYVYLLSFDNSMKYVGCHSTHLSPELDVTYLGSGSKLPARTHKTCKKEILSIHETREQAINAEIDFIQKNNCVNSEEYYNVRLKTFDKHGSKLSENHKKIISENSKKPRNFPYRGKDRTPAQIQGSINASKKLTGVKNLSKGHKGITNCAFKPWYFITPEGIRTEVYDITKKDYASKLGFTHRQLVHRFHYTNQHNPGKTHPFKGWTFGDL